MTATPRPETQSPSKKLKLGLLPRILIAIALGIGVGWIAPEWAARTMATFNSIFGEFLGFCIPLIIVGFVAPAIADIGARAGKMLVVTVLLAYFFTMLAGVISYFTGVWLFPSMIEPAEYVASATGAPAVTPYFTISMPPLLGVMSALVSAFIIGLGGGVPHHRHHQIAAR